MADLCLSKVWLWDTALPGCYFPFLLIFRDAEERAEAEDGVRTLSDGLVLHRDVAMSLSIIVVKKMRG